MGSIAHKGRDPSHQVSLHDWVLYVLRFILTGDLRNAWKEFGGLCAQLSFLSIASPGRGRELGILDFLRL